MITFYTALSSGKDALTILGQKHNDRARYVVRTIVPETNTSLTKDMMVYAPGATLNRLNAKAHGVVKKIVLFIHKGFSKLTKDNENAWNEAKVVIEQTPLEKARQLALASKKQLDELQRNLDKIFGKK